MKTKDIISIAEQEYPYMELTPELKDHQAHMDVIIDGNRIAFERGFLAGLSRGHEWIKFDDEYPPDHARYLVFRYQEFEMGACYIQDICLFDKEDEYCFVDHHGGRIEVSHWAKLSSDPA